MEAKSPVRGRVVSLVALAISLVLAFTMLGQNAVPAYADVASAPQAQSQSLQAAGTGDIVALENNLSNRFAQGGADAALDNGTWYAAFGLRDLDRASQIDAQSSLATMSENENLSAGTVAKYILMLTQANVDCTKASDGTQTVDLIDRMHALETSAPDTYSAVLMLPVYQTYPSKASEAPFGTDDLIDVILAGQCTDGVNAGLFGQEYPGFGAYYDTETTAQAILALMPYRSDSRVSAAIEKGEEALMAAQNSDGGFAYYYDGQGAKGASNVDATALCAVALKALGKDANGSDCASDDGVTPISWLVSTADDGLTGYEGATEANESWSAACALYALADYAGVVDVPMNRLYNPFSGEHFYTASTYERDYLVGLGWNDEGKGWTAPSISTAPVYRLYNPYSGDHHFTQSTYERDMLLGIGWNDEGIGFYSDASQTVPVYRQYNPYAAAFYHNYTASVQERSFLVSIGWRDEGIGWYGIE